MCKIDFFFTNIHQIHRNVLPLTLIGCKITYCLIFIFVCTITYRWFWNIKHNLPFARGSLYFCSILLLTFYCLFGKTGPSCFRNKLNFWKKVFLVKLWEKEIIGPWGPNIWLTDRMGLFTWIWRHQRSCIHVIIYVGLYVYPWYWK